MVTLFRWLPVHQDQVEKVFQKQASMQEMFDKRRVSLKKLAAKQTRPVQPVAPRPEAFIKSPLSSPGQSSHGRTLLVMQCRAFSDFLRFLCSSVLALLEAC